MDFEVAVLGVGVVQTYALIRAVKKWRHFAPEPLHVQRRQQNNAFRDFLLLQAVRKWRVFAKRRNAEAIINASVSRNIARLALQRWRIKSRYCRGFRKLQQFLFVRPLNRRICFQRWRQTSIAITRKYNAILALDSLRLRYLQRLLFKRWQRRVWLLSLIDDNHLSDDDDDEEEVKGAGGGTGGSGSNYGSSHGGRTPRRHVSAITFKLQCTRAKLRLASLIRIHSLKLSFHAWMKARQVQRLQAAHEFLADAVYSKHVLSHAFAQWREALAWKREYTQVWKPKLSIALQTWREFLQKRHHMRHKLQLVEDMRYFHTNRRIFDVWKAKTTATKQSMYRHHFIAEKVSHRLLRTTMQNWKHALQDIHVRRQQERIATVHWGNTLLKKVFVAWHEWSVIERVQTIARQHAYKTLARKVFLHWRAISSQERHLRNAYQKVKEMRDSNQKYALFQVWKEWSARRAIIYRRVQRYMKAKEITQLRKHIVQWRLQAKVKAQVRQRIMEMHAKRERRTLPLLFHAWKSYTHMSSSASHAYEQVYTRYTHSLQRQVLRGLSRAAHTHSLEARRAEVEERTRVNLVKAQLQAFKCKESIRRWRIFTRTAIRIALQSAELRHKHRMRTMRESFRGWMQYTMKKERTLQLKQAANRFDAVRRAFAAWTSWRVLYTYEVQLRGIEERAVQERHRKMMQIAFFGWRKHTRTQKKIAAHFFAGASLRATAAIAAVGVGDGDGEEIAGAPRSSVSSSLYSLNYKDAGMEEMMRIGSSSSSSSPPGSEESKGDMYQKGSFHTRSATTRPPRTTMSRNTTSLLVSSTPDPFTNVTAALAETEAKLAAKQLELKWLASSSSSSSLFLSSNSQLLGTSKGREPIRAIPEMKRSHTVVDHHHPQHDHPPPPPPHHHARAVPRSLRGLDSIIPPSTAYIISTANDKGEVEKPESGADEYGDENHNENNSSFTSSSASPQGGGGGGGWAQNLNEKEAPSSSSSATSSLSISSPSSLAVPKDRIQLIYAALASARESTHRGVEKEEDDNHNDEVGEGEEIEKDQIFTEDMYDIEKFLAEA